MKKFQNEIDEVCEKFIHSLNLLSSIKIGVNEEVFDDDFNLSDRYSLLFILVIKNHEIGWCKEVKRKLITSLPSYLKLIWKPEIYVINHKMALKRNLAMS